MSTLLNSKVRKNRMSPIFYLWRPFLRDPKDDMVLELAVNAGCGLIITFNHVDFQGVDEFGIRTATPRRFLQGIGELP